MGCGASWLKYVDAVEVEVESWVITMVVSTYSVGENVDVSDIKVHVLAIATFLRQHEWLWRSHVVDFFKVSNAIPPLHFTCKLVVRSQIHPLLQSAEEIVGKGGWGLEQLLKSCICRELVASTIGYHQGQIINPWYYGLPTMLLSFDNWTTCDDVGW